jgi:hypothetical protein
MGALASAGTIKMSRPTTSGSVTGEGVGEATRAPPGGAGDVLALREARAVPVGLRVLVAAPVFDMEGLLAAEADKVHRQEQRALEVGLSVGRAEGGLPEGDPVSERAVSLGGGLGLANGEP